jgi:putative tryptophan/tyrosine transport system substrate-binding protein
LISYILDVSAQVRQIAPYFDRILRGEKPADLPVQQPEKFQPFFGQFAKDRKKFVSDD